MSKRVMTIIAALAILLVSIIPASAQVQIHGFAQVRTIVEQDDYTPARVDRFGFRVQEVIDDEFSWLVETYVHPWNAPVSQVYMESAYLNWNMEQYVPWDFSVRFGKGRNETYGIAPYYSSRRTSDYSLYSEAFTQSRVHGVQTFSNFGDISLAVGILNGYTVGAGRSVPDMPIDATYSTNIPLGDGETSTSGNKRVALSGRVGWANEILNVGGSLYMSELNATDNNEQQRIGVDGELNLPSGLMAQGQFTMAKTGVVTGITADTLDHMGMEVLGGYETDMLGLYARYGMLTYDDTLQGLNQIMVSALYKIRPRVQLRLEALINGEEEDSAKGWAEVDNNRLFFETLFAF